MAGKTWVLDTDTKGTGANMVPLEKVLEKPEPEPAPRRPAAVDRPRRAEPTPRTSRPAARPVEKTSTPLPAGHVRKRATGEIGKVQAVDAKAGTVTVLWLKGGATSVVPLASVTRR
jgi:hypothetical protein